MATTRAASLAPSTSIIATVFGATVDPDGAKFDRWPAAAAAGPTGTPEFLDTPAAASLRSAGWQEGARGPQEGVRRALTSEVGETMRISAGPGSRLLAARRR